MDGHKCFLKKVNTDSLSTADLFQHPRFPGLAFHHFRQQRQSDGDDLAILCQSIRDAGYKLLFVV